MNTWWIYIYIYITYIGLNSTYMNICTKCYITIICEYISLQNISYTSQNGMNIMIWWRHRMSPYDPYFNLDNVIFTNHIFWVGVTKLHFVKFSGIFCSCKSICLLVWITFTFGRRQIGTWFSISNQCLKIMQKLENIRTGGVGLVNPTPCLCCHGCGLYFRFIVDRVVTRMDYKNVFGMQSVLWWYDH